MYDIRENQKNDSDDEMNQRMIAQTRRDMSTGAIFCSSKCEQLKIGLIPRTYQNRMKMG